MFISIWLIVLSIGLVTIDNGEEMENKYLWNLNVKITGGATESVSLEIAPSNQSLLEIEFMYIKASYATANDLQIDISLDDSLAGARLVKIVDGFQLSGLNIFYYPVEDYLSTFKLLKINPIMVYQGDVFRIITGIYNGETLEIVIRGKLSNYALPSVDLVAATSTLATNANKIVGGN